MRNTMLRKRSGVCSCDSKSSGGTSGVTFDSTKRGFKSNNTDSEGSEFSVNNSFLSDRGTPIYNHSLSFPLSDVTHTGNYLNLLENTSSNDFLCGDLPEIGSFEDVDRMFRRSDSTFGLVDSKEDVFGWLSPEYDKVKSGEALQSDFGFPCHETSMQSNVSENYGSSKCYTELSDAPIWIEDGSCAREKSDSYTSFVDELEIGDGRHGFIPEEQMNQCKNQPKQLKHMEKRRKEHNLGNGSNSYLGNLPYEINQLSTMPTSLHGYPSASMSQQLHAAGPDSFFYLHNNGSQSYSDNSQLSERASVTFADSTTLTPWVPSPTSNQMQFMGNSHAQSLLTAISGTDNGVDIHTFQSYLSSQSASLMEQAFVRNPGLVGKRVKLCEDKFEDPTDAGGASLAIPVESGSSNVQESSMITMGVDDISLAAASFCQIQLVMEWLDLRTKLCIRDGLYRLAQRAEQRMKHANLHGNSSGGSCMAEETNNCNSLINMETGTNPIDRSIAQLLFHQPSNSSVIFAHDV